MKKKFAIEGIDCANCAAKIEALISKIPGVNSCNLNFIAEKITIDADDERFDEIIDEAEEKARKVDKGCIIKR